MHISDLETPALVIDLDGMERNLQKAARYTEEHNLRLRPHTKTHKMPPLARRQLELGAVGLAVAKVGEAEVMLSAAPPNVLVAYPVVGLSKLKRLMEVGRRTQVTVALDSLTAAQQLSDAAGAAGLSVGVLAEVDVGFQRIGIAPAELRVFAERLMHLRNVSFEGIAFFPGHILQLNDTARRQLDELGRLIVWMLGELAHSGIEARIVSGGSTPTLFQSHLVPGLNEIRSGTYIFNDMNTVRCEACSLADCAASVVVTVVSCASKGRIIVDGGSKTFSSDLPVNGSSVNFGYVVEAPNAKFYKMNEEHGYINVQDVERRFSVGDRLHIIPNHICPTVNLNEVAFGVRGTVVEQSWKVEARGKIT